MIAKRINFLKRGLLFVLVFGFACSMGDKNKTNTANEPGFANLAEGEGSFRALVYDESNQYTLKDFSFFGHTTVGGVRRETDDSMTRFELSKIKELKVLKPHFDSKRFGDKEFLLAEVTASTGAVTSDLLVPKKLVICGIDEKSGLEKSWFLQKIDRIVMLGATPLVLPSIPAALTDQKAMVGSTAPTPPASLIPAVPVPTAGSQEKTRRTFRPAKPNKWDAFYQNNQMPKGDTQEVVTPAKRSIGEAFVAIIDAIIDFFYAIINGLLKLF
jgi:hypothetical protein